MEFGEFLWSLLLIFFFVMYLMILFSVVVDLFRNHQMSGIVKAIWIIFLIFIPLISLLVYVIVYGRGMATRQQEAVVAAQKEQAAYIQQVAGTSAADQIAQAQQLLQSGAISQDEFDKLKAKALS
ncbi:MAG: SHOCT domain-containing protein [Actinomycetales bacterium]|nr:SHOCT domain-containing protein [Actinomycetales bacterium]